MPAARLRETEAADQAALHALHVLDSAPEAEFDALVQAAALVCDVPVSLISLLDADRQWFKAKVGLPEAVQTPRDFAFCAHAVLGTELLEVADATQDPRFSDNPLVLGDPDIRFYAGAPLRLSNGASVGTLCVIDHKPRRLTERQRDVLRQLALAAARALEGREAIRAIHRTQSFLDRSGRLAGVGGWEVDLRTQVVTWSDETRRIHQVGPEFVPTVDSCVEFFEPQVRAVVASAVADSIKLGQAWDLELPLITAKGQAIWVRTIGDVECEAGRAARLVGAIQNVTEHRMRRTELLQEQALRAQIEQQVRTTEQLLQERSEMLDVLAHEVRQPLNNASAAMQGAARALAGLGEKIVSPQVSRAQSVLAQVTSSIDNILAVASLLARPDPIHRADAEVDTLIAVAVTDLPAADRVRVRVERLTGTRTASMDMSLMRLALRNLLVNACKYSPAGSEVIVRLTESDDPLALVVDVIDAGSAIPSGLLPRLFQRGARGTHASGAPGLGLGLYIVRRVMELHRGSAEVLRNEADGVTFRLLLGQSPGD